jgi:arylsulfatase A-like enzyme
LPAPEDQESQPRSIFSIEAKTNVAFAPLKKTTIAMRKGTFKLVAYLGYPEFDRVFELYDIDNDPEEMKDLAAANPAEFAPLREELLDTLADANRPFEKENDPAS